MNAEATADQLVGYSPPRLSARRWRVLRLAAGALQFAGVAVVLLVHPRAEGILLGVALMLAGRGLRRVRWISREQLTAAARLGAVSFGVLLVLAATTALLSGPPPFAQRPGIATLLHESVLRLLGGVTEWSHATPLASTMSAVLPFVTALVGLAMVAIVVGPQADDAEPDAGERWRIARLCDGGDSDLMAPFTARRDKQFVTSPDGRAAIGYRVKFGVAVAGPGPVGSPEAHHEAIVAWLQRCDERGWRPAMIGATTAVRQITRELGMRGLCIGDEVLLPVEPFRLNTPAMRNVRQAVQRTRNSGVEVTIHREGEISRIEREALREVVAEWRAGHGERGFAMTLDHLLDDTYHDAMLAVAHHGGTVVGFQRYLVCRGGTGLSLDVMPRRRRAPNGVNERLIVEAVQWAATQGIRDLSLNFAAFRTLFEASPTPGRRALRTVVHRLDRFLDVESLYRFNAKFCPQWNARHVLFGSPFDLPLVLAAALRVEFDGGRSTGARDQVAAELPAREG